MSQLTKNTNSLNNINLDDYLIQVYSFIKEHLSDENIINKCSTRTTDKYYSHIYIWWDVQTRKFILDYTPPKNNYLYLIKEDRGSLKFDPSSEKIKVNNISKLYLDTIHKSREQSKIKKSGSF